MPQGTRPASGLPEFLRQRGFLSEDETAAALDRGVRTLKRWRQLRIGPKYTTIGGVEEGQVIYHEDWILDHLKSNAKQPVRERERVRGKSETQSRRKQASTEQEQHNNP
jgi:hypothetical protein